MKRTTMRLLFAAVIACAGITIGTIDKLSAGDNPEFWKEYTWGAGDYGYCWEISCSLSRWCCVIMTPE